MDTLRVLVVDQDQSAAELLASVLMNANHSALPAAGLEEATEALFVQKFDAVLLSSPLPSDGVAEFTAKLRELESRQRAAARTPVLSLCTHVPNGAEWCASGGAEPESGSDVDGYLAHSFDPILLCEAVRTLAAGAITGERQEGTMRDRELPVLDAERFREQMGFDQDLLVEIIDLFFAEGPQQVIEMREALGAEDFERLSRLAHTIKGSFGTLHAAAARAHAQELEAVSKQREVARCRKLLSQIEYDLEMLEPLLSALRDPSPAA